MIRDSFGPTAIGAAQPPIASVGDFVALLKPRVMSLVVFTGLIGLVMAPGGIHPLTAFTAILCIAVGAGASGAINMWYDRDIDAVMARTRRRPIPAGRVDPSDALAFGVILAIGAVAVMGLAVNWVAAALLAGSIGFYVLIYTMWLKRLTPQNIVIGGAAGAFPAPIGWAAVTGGLDLTPMLLFLVVFLWTPPHFWALSLYRAEDYARAGVPMLPVVAGPSETRRQIAGYGWAMVIASLAPVATGAVGAAYAVAAVVLGMIFMMRVEAVRTSGVGDSAADDRACRRLFKFSLLYLFLLFLSLPVDRVIGRGAW